MDKNAIGDKGENIFNLEISTDYTFRPRHLGEKWPSSDFYVELIGPKENFYFIVQVKSTSQGLDGGNNLKIQASAAKLRKLSNYYCPTYLAGVDVNTREVYLVPINKSKRKNLTKLSTTFHLNKQNRKLLYKDVKNFWSNSDLKKYKRTFKHTI
jgi:hypothetical protein